MSKQTINIGASPNDGTGTPLRTSFDYCNLNFTEIYTALGGGVALPGATTQVIFNDGGTNLAGDAGLVYNKTTDALTVAGLVTAGSATITGDLTVDTSTLKVDSTNNRVIVGHTSGSAPFQVTNAGAAGLELHPTGASSAPLIISYNRSGLTYTQLTIDASTIVHQLSGSTAMTLNSTGLGVGASPTGTGPIFLLEGIAGRYARFDSKVGAKTWSTGYRSGTLQFEIQEDGVERFVIANGGNVGVGVTPSAWNSAVPALQVKGVSGIYGAGSSEFGSVQNCFFNASSQWIYGTTAAAGKYAISSGVHQWFNAPSGTAGNAITFTQAMTLDASGRLLVGSTAAFTDLSGSKEVKIGDSGMQALTVASLPAATATNIARGGLGGLVYVGAFNGTGQYGAVVLWTAASATVVSVINGTGSTITFGVSGGFLQITSSLVLTQVTASCIRI
jgi:hypothetical protein